MSREATYLHINYQLRPEVQRSNPATRGQLRHAPGPSSFVPASPSRRSIAGLHPTLSAYASTFDTFRVGLASRDPVHLPSP